jgi:hypothetical protein
MEKHELSHNDIEKDKLRKRINLSLSEPVENQYPEYDDELQEETSQWMKENKFNIPRS